MSNCPKCGSEMLFHVQGCPVWQGDICSFCGDDSRFTHKSYCFSLFPDHHHEYRYQDYIWPSRQRCICGDYIDLSGGFPVQQQETAAGKILKSEN